MPNSIAGWTSVSWQDWLTLCKPRVVALMLLTSVVGMLLATDGWVPLSVLVLGNLGIGLVAAGGAAINHLVDQQIDQQMLRTHKRPIATGRIALWQGSVFAALLIGAGMGLLLVFINPLTAWLTLAALVGYAFIYTGQNIVIGGLAGAAPPLLGWTAVTNEISSLPLLLVLIIFAWTPPHFWALAIERKEEYARADIPMLPVTHGVEYTKLQALLYTILMIVVSLLPFIIQVTGLLYCVGVCLLNARFLYWVLALKYNWHPQAARRTFRFSISYLMLLFILLLADHYAGHFTV